MANKDNYLEKRLQELNITSEKNTIRCENLDGREETFQFFSEKKNGDIVINYLSPSGMIEYYEGKKGKEQAFTRLRFKNPQNPKRKYFQAPNTETIPFSTPIIVKAFKSKEKVKTLYVTEGEFKAFALDNLGLPCFGIGGIHNFKNKEKDKIHSNILEFVEICKVENIVLLFDADCLHVEWKENEELTQRLNTFYTAVRNFNELLKPYEISLYFAYIDKKSEFKGIDDLLYNGVSNQQEIINELKSLLEGAHSRKYIHTYKISDVADATIKQIFGLKDVQNFYNENENILRDKEFIFKGNKVYFDNEKNKLIPVFREKPSTYLRIGTDYYKKVVHADPKGNNEIDIVLWTKGALKEDYKSLDFLNSIKKYDAFANIPENDPSKYKQTIESEKSGIKSILYNRYFPLHYTPQKGNWHNIDILLHHIFDYQNNTGVSLYEFILDYLKLLYCNPIQKLPVLCLVSKENETGKTTFLNFLKAIFSENMRILDNDRISSQFNSGYAGKLLIAIDETIIATDKPIVKSRIKMITTNNTIPLEGKGKDSKEIFNFSKLVMCSNDENNFMQIDEQENRYCIIKVPTIPKEKRDPKLFDKMISEIPAFLYFLQNRNVYYTEKTRLWFDYNVYFTPQLSKVIERTENQLHKAVKDAIKNQFFWQGKEEIKISLSKLHEAVSKDYRFADKRKVQEFLLDKGYKVGEKCSFDFCYCYDDISTIRVRDRCYQFKVLDWLNNEELKQFYE